MNVYARWKPADRARIHIKCNIITDVFPDKPPCVQTRLPLPSHDTYPLELPTGLRNISQCLEKSSLIDS